MASSHCQHGSVNSTKRLAPGFLADLEPFRPYRFHGLLSHFSLFSKHHFWASSVSGDMYSPDWRRAAQAPDSPTAELSVAAQLHLLRALVQVKQPWSETTAPLHHELDALTQALFWTSADPAPNSCLFESLGTFLVQVLGVLSQLSISLTNGPHMIHYHECYARSVGNHNDFADLPAVSAFLDMKSTLLE